MIQQKQSVAEESDSPPTPSRSATAAYIADLTAEMERLAQRERLAPLDRLLGVAREEARRMAAEP